MDLIDEVRTGPCYGLVPDSPLEQPYEVLLKGSEQRTQFRSRMTGRAETGRCNGSYHEADRVSRWPSTTSVKPSGCQWRNRYAAISVKRDRYAASVIPEGLRPHYRSGSGGMSWLEYPPSSERVRLRDDHDRWRRRPTGPYCGCNRMVRYRGRLVCRRQEPYRVRVSPDRRSPPQSGPRRTRNG